MDDLEIQQVVEKVGQNLLKIRKEKGLSQQELALRSDIEKPYIRKIEKGRTNPTIKTLAKICFSLEIPINQIFLFDAE